MTDPRRQSGALPRPGLAVACAIALASACFTAQWPAALARAGEADAPAPAAPTFSDRLLALRPMLGKYRAEPQAGTNALGQPVERAGWLIAQWTLENNYVQVDFEAITAGPAGRERALWRGMISWDQSRGLYTGVWLGPEGRRFSGAGPLDDAGRVLRLSADPDEGAAGVSVELSLEAPDRLLLRTLARGGADLQETETLRIEYLKNPR